ncbi:hypothetical protein VPH35_110807 [Triticum aestivum]|uniref:uncharacterized protein isoform X1 n=1 Tax=Triticum aestivum TaxID=4565 RepID=UPI001D006406|nr:uncharacterized protein LOC123137062 isoform X1 [Triticum aestivum]
MEAASPCFNYSSGPPSARALPPRVPPATTVSWLSPAQRWCISCSQIQARAPTPSTTGSRARRWATALPTARGSSPQCRRGSGPVSYTPPSNTSLRPSFIEPAAALPSYSCPCSSIDVPAVIHCTANILSPADLQLGEVSNYSWRRSRPAACRVCRCRRGPPHTLDVAATTPTTVRCRCVQPRPATHWTWAQRQGHAEGARAQPPTAGSPAGCSGKTKCRSSKMKFEEGNMQQSKKWRSHYSEEERLAIQPS